MCKLAERRWVRIWRHVLLTFSLLSRGYPYKLISEQISHVSHIVRTISLTRSSNKNTNEKRITFTTQFHPSIATFLNNVNKDWLIIRTDNRFNNKLSNPIILSNKQPRNLQQLHTRYKNTFLQCNQPCHKPRCKVCSHIDIRCSIKFDNNVTISAAKADCDSLNEVYIYFVLSARTLFMLVKLPTVLDFVLTIINIALDTFFLVTP